MREQLEPCETLLRLCRNHMETIWDHVGHIWERWGPCGDHVESFVAMCYGVGTMWEPFEFQLGTGTRDRGLGPGTTDRGL